jgi:hypothetical protein
MIKLLKSVRNQAQNTLLHGWRELTLLGKSSRTSRPFAKHQVIASRMAMLDFSGTRNLKTFGCGFASLNLRHELKLLLITLAVWLTLPGYHGFNK